MPNLRSQSVTPTTITVVSSAGVSFTLTKVDIQAFYQTTTGNAAARKAATVAWALGRIETALGAGLVPAAKGTLDFDDVTGDLKFLRYNS